MSKRRGLSVEEKRTRLLNIFYEKKDFFLLKELEKIAPKEKGTARGRGTDHNSRPGCSPKKSLHFVPG